LNKSKTNKDFYYDDIYILYQQHTIEFKCGYVGHETLFIDGECIIKSFNWKRQKTHNITVEGDELSLTVMMLSMTESKIKVTLKKGEQILDSQTQYFNIDGTTDGLNVFDEAELKWKKELEMSRSNTLLSYILYFAILIFGVVGAGLSANIAIAIIAGAGVLAIFEFAKTSIKALSTPNEPDELEI
jgi:hypothetical protein